MDLCLCAACTQDDVLPAPRPNTPGLGAGVQWSRDGGAPSSGSIAQSRSMP
eukprot:COSAG05_NODE_19021_length_299_cov_0.715000_1_plen_50_part_10